MDRASATGYFLEATGKSLSFSAIFFLQGFQKADERGLCVIALHESRPLSCLPLIFEKIILQIILRVQKPKAGR